ncbi:ABC transporter substrate-binding protein [Geodermatophilus maliterrae]|uniref:ABC transporter substrate-binding protein n=1 Tax=Geodermatophilus maliterrae TaxID=3162531 RepID=A0ABV3XGW6_9ACTN
MSARRKSLTSRPVRGAALLVAVAALTAACGGGSGGEGEETGAAASTAGSEAAAAVEADQELNAMLPADVRDAGTLEVGTEALYPPYEYLDEDGQTIIGLDPDLLDAITGRLGVEYTLTNTAFDGLLPALDGDRFDVVAAAVTDTTERQANYDFVDYFLAGQAIVVASGNPEGIETVEDLCGQPVSVLVSSAQESLLNQFNGEQCAADPIQITSLPTDQDALLQVQSGRATASFTQEPVGRYNAAQIAGGNAFEVANAETLFPSPLGYVFDKEDTQLRDAWQAALQSLIEDGTYTEILESHGLESGAVDEATINAGTQ